MLCLNNKTVCFKIIFWIFLHFFPSILAVLVYHRFFIDIQVVFLTTISYCITHCWCWRVRIQNIPLCWCIRESYVSDIVRSVCIPSQSVGLRLLQQCFNATFTDTGTGWVNVCSGWQCLHFYARSVFQKVLRLIGDLYLLFPQQKERKQQQRKKLSGDNSRNRHQAGGQAIQPVHRPDPPASQPASQQASKQPVHLAHEQ